jgi:hypothetical protein
LSVAGEALQLSEERARSFPLRSPTRRPPSWHGIGGFGDRILVWGAGALLELGGDAFVPFEPEAGLEESEAVLAVAPEDDGLAMLVCGEHGGAVARFDGEGWLTIAEDEVIEGALLDLDAWRGATLVLARDGRVWRAHSGRPRASSWTLDHPAFFAESGVRRVLHGVRAIDGGALLASDGGVIAVGDGDPVFFAAGQSSEPARLARMGDGAIVATCGPNAWVWRRRGFHVLDLRQW